MKKLVITFAVLMMLTGATVSALKTMGIGPFAPELESDSTVREALDEPPRFIEMAPLVIPVFHGDQVAATIHIEIKLETMGSENEDTINHLLPRLSDAFWSDLYAFLPRLLRQEERVNVVAIKERLQMVGDKVAGPGVIDGVLVQSVTDITP